MLSLETINQNYKGMLATEKFVATHLNDPEINKALLILEKLEEEYKHMTFDRHTNNGHMVLYRRHRDLFKELSEVFTKRFGFNIKFVASDQSFFSVYGGPKNSNVILDGKEVRESLIDFEADLEEYMETAREYDSTISLSYCKEKLKEVAQAINTIDAVSDQCYSGGIVVDNEAIKVKNLDKKAVLLVNLDLLDAFSSEVDMTKEEVMAVILHEVGHAFSYFSQTYKSYCGFIAFQNAVKDLARKESDYKKLMVLAYERATGEVNVDKEFQNANYEVTTVGIANKLLMLYGRDQTYASSTWSEHIADQFASRFGYGKELVIALNKLSNYDYNRFLFSFNSLPKCNWFITVFLNIFSFFLKLAILPLYVLLKLMFYVFGTLNVFIKNLFYLGDDELTHDTPDRRKNRIRNELVNMLRDTKLTKEQREKITNDIKTIDDLYQIAAKTHYDIIPASVLEAIFSLFSKYRNNRERGNIYYELEKLMANDLHIASAKLKNLMKG